MKQHKIIDKNLSQFSTTSIFFLIGWFRELKYCFNFVFQDKNFKCLTRGLLGDFGSVKGDKEEQKTKRNVSLFLKQFTFSPTCNISFLKNEEHRTCRKKKNSDNI